MIAPRETKTIEDLNHIIDFAKRSKSCAVIGGGLLGLEAAKAAFDLGLETHVVALGNRLLPRQLDDKASAMLVSKIEALGIRIHLNSDTTEVLGKKPVEGLRIKDGGELNADMLVVSAGIVPRDELGRTSGLQIGPRGGIVVNDLLQTSDPNVFAIGEVALHQSMTYGLVAPGYEMAEIVAAYLCDENRTFAGADMSTKLKLTGVDVASFGNYEADPAVATAIVFEDPFAGVYKKVLVTRDGKKLLGGILVGDADDYVRLLMTRKSDKPLSVSPAELLLGPKGQAAGALDDLSADAQICSCNNVSMSNARRGCDGLLDRGTDRLVLTRVGSRSRQASSCRRLGKHRSGHGLISNGPVIQAPVSGPIVAALTARFLEQTCWTKGHASIHGFAHVVNSESRDGHRCQRFHLDAGPSMHPHCRFDPQRGPVNWSHVDVNTIDSQRMTQRDQVGSSLGRHDSGQAGDFHHITLRDLSIDDESQGFRLHHHERLRARHPVRDVLGPDIDHATGALVIEMCQFRHRSILTSTIRPGY